MKHLIKFGLVTLVIAYWIMPFDFMMFSPIDDVIITLLAGCASKKMLAKAK